MTITTPSLNVGDTTKLLHGSEADARRNWTVRARDERYVILTRQADFKPKGELFYTIIDFEWGVRGPCNLIGQGYDVESEGGPEALLADLQSGAVEVSHRNNVQIGFVE